MEEDPLAGFCKHGEEHFDFMKGGIFLTELLTASQERLSSKELTTVFHVTG
jgi:hypothetical protein